MTTNNKRHLVYVASYFAAIFALPLGIATFVPHLADEWTGFVFATSLVAVAAFGLWLYRDVMRDKRHALKGQRMKLLRQCLLGFGVVLFLRIAVVAIFGTQSVPNQEALDTVATRIPWWLTVVSFALAAPIVEELIFREIFLRHRAPKWVWCSVSAVVFAGLHATQWYPFLMYFPLSVLFVFLYEQFEENVVASMAMHVLNNAIGVLAMLLLR